VVLHELKGLLQTSFSSSSSSTSFSDPKPKDEEQHRVGINFAGTIYRVPGLFTFVDKKIIQEWARKWQQGLFVSTDIRSVKSMPRNQPPLSLSMKDMCRWFHNNVYSESSLLLGRVDGQQGKEKPKYVKICCTSVINSVSPYQTGVRFTVKWDVPSSSRSHARITSTILRSATTNDKSLLAAEGGGGEPLAAIDWVDFAWIVKYDYSKREYLEYERNMTTDIPYREMFVTSGTSQSDLVNAVRTWRRPIIIKMRRPAPVQPVI
jgi:hypothetical protein